MELESYHEEEKQSFGMEQEMGGWEETKEEVLPRTKEEIVSSLEKLYGPSISCSFSENNESFALVVEQEACMLSDDMLKSFLPKSSYEALSSYYSNSSKVECTNIVEAEELIRLAFQNGTDIPAECRSVLFQLSNPQPCGGGEIGKVGGKRTRK